MYSSILFSTIIKGILIYVLALILSKLIGIKIISQMNFFDFIMGVSIGAMIAKIIIDIEDIFYAGIDQNKKLIISQKYPDDFNIENKFGIE